MITVNHIQTWILNHCHRIRENAHRLNLLDADGDCGASMQRGLDAVEIALEQESCNSIGEILTVTGSQLMSAMGGTSGPIIGAFFLTAGKHIGECPKCDLLTFASSLQAGVDRVKEIGRVDLGMKTMIDAFVPAVNALTIAAQNQLETEAAFHEAAQAASTGAEFTRYIPACIGRMSTTSERGLGKLDPGALGIAILFGSLDLVNFD